MATTHSITAAPVIVADGESAVAVAAVSAASTAPLVIVASGEVAVAVATSAEMMASDTSAAVGDAAVAVAAEVHSNVAATLPSTNSIAIAPQLDEPARSQVGLVSASARNRTAAPSAGCATSVQPASVETGAFPSLDVHISAPLVGEPKAGSVNSTEKSVPVLVALLRIAPEPLEPVVSTPSSSINTHAQVD